jgi:hypothetical protein
MNSGELIPVGEESFEEEDRRYIELYTQTVESQTELAEELLLDPLPQLQDKLHLEGDWTITLDRTNAEIGVGRPNAEFGVGIRKPPRKIIVTWIVLRQLNRVHGVVYRRPPEPEDTETPAA